MSEFQAFVDNATTKSLSGRFVIRIYADTFEEAKAKLSEGDIGDGNTVTAIYEVVESDNDRKEFVFREGEDLKSEVIATYRRQTRNLKAMKKNGPPSLDDVASRYPFSGSGMFILVVGWLCVLGASFVAMAMMSQGAVLGAMMITVALPLFVTGTLMIFGAWCGRMLNNIAISNRYQAELARHQFRESQKP